jgi:3alpha(or 20beta)-hydroxysteroid dehydrogenase
MRAEDRQMRRFEGRVAIVTGAARGTGEATARRFAAEGAAVILADVRDEQGEAVAKDLGAPARYLHLDVSREEDWARAMDAATRELGRLDVLVNNAAILHLGPLAKTSLETWNRVVAVNQTGPFLGIRAAIAPMRAAGGGSIVNIASIDGLEGMNGVSAYASTKWALRGLSRCAALELGRFGIRVNTVCPAGGNDEMSAPFRPPGVDAQGFVENRAIPRRATLGEIAAMILFLCSDEAAFCTGGDYTVDGGHTSGTFVPGIPNA